MLPIIIEVAISIIVVYFILSTLVAFIVEAIAVMVNIRGKLLYQSIVHLLGESNEKSETITQTIYDSPLVNDLSSHFSIVASLFNCRKKRPEYIDAKNFVSSLLVSIQPKPSLNNNGDTVKVDLTSNLNQILSLDAVKNNKVLSIKLQEFVNELAIKGELNLPAFRLKLEEWFNQYQTSVSVIYKNYMKVWVFLVSFIIAFAMNVDSLVLIEYFFENKHSRDLMIAYAENQQLPSTQYNIDNTKVNEQINSRIDSVTNTLNALHIPFGWTSNLDSPKIQNQLRFEQSLLNNDKPTSCLLKFAGLFLTAVSLSLGAPFWYQLMVKLLQLRKGLHQEETKKTN